MHQSETFGSGAPAGLSREGFDVVVLGGGSAGEELCEALREQSGGKGSLAIAVVESNLVGGECPYLACMPSKAMLRSASVRRQSLAASRLGSEQAGPHSPIAAWREAVRRRDVVADQRQDDEHVSALEELGVRLFRGRGRIEAWGELVVESGDGAGQSLGWTELVLATGSHPTMPPVTGLSEVESWTSDIALSTGELPEAVVILGGGAVGCELAEIYAAYLPAGKVILLESAERLVASEEEATTRCLAEHLGKIGVDVRTSCKLEKVERHGKATLLFLEGGEEIETSRLIVAAGRAPNVAGLGLEQLGIEPSPKGGAIEVDEQLLAASEPGGKRRVFAVGDVNGIAPFTHVAKYESRIVAQVIGGNEARADRRALPRCVFTDPPLAAVGLTADAARREGVDVAVEEMDLAQTARAEAEGLLSEGELSEEATGHLVLVADRARGVLVGASGFGPRADEWLSELGLAIRAEIPLELLAELVHPFPTYSEAFTPAFRRLVKACRRS